MKLIALREISTVSRYCQLQSLTQCKLQNTDINSSSSQPKAKFFNSFKTNCCKLLYRMVQKSGHPICFAITSTNEHQFFTIFTVITKMYYA